MKTSIYRLMVFVLGLSFCSFGIGKGIFKIDTLVKISYNSPNDTVLSNNNNPLYVGPSLFRCDDDTVIFVYEGYNNTLIKLNVRQGIVWKKKLPNNIAPLDFTIFESDICMFSKGRIYRFAKSDFQLLRVDSLKLSGEILEGYNESLFYGKYLLIGTLDSKHSYRYLYDLSSGKMSEDLNLRASFFPVDSCNSETEETLKKIYNKSTIFVFGQSARVIMYSEISGDKMLSLEKSEERFYLFDKKLNITTELKKFPDFIFRRNKHSIDFISNNRAVCYNIVLKNGTPQSCVFFVVEFAL